ncbi:MAG: HPr family phosphocarrier protein [Acidimicrobiales bacterium]|nr:HPr family phosphocarrier protein [Acidimicrobiaceae bacterium]MXY03588.1 HPr family phosphocarrier protein [Acidimicrobiales bacterium]MYG60278.1 HPr family phosphocarrier protein [Acidimicrobiales bacterium]MYG89310.1 HPr family phosphocarrier protein [Acidimicrobiales bacterium]MYI29141.1 HPr family phosphocarrier protein [Acidimicrobiales bacterium]
MDPMIAEVVITNPHGLHARPAAVMVEKLKAFDAEVRIEAGQKTANAVSIMSVLALGAGPGDTARVHSEGPQAEAALEAVVAILTEEE